MRRFQDLVSEGLAQLGVPHVVEAKVSCPRFGDTTVDILVEAADGARVAVEVDGGGTANSTCGGCMMTPDVRQCNGPSKYAFTQLSVCVYARAFALHSAGAI